MPVGAALISAEDALRRTLADYLGGTNGPLGSSSTNTPIQIDTGQTTGPFQLAEALDEWPGGETGIKYPGISLVPIPGTYAEHSTTETILEADPVTGLIGSWAPPAPTTLKTGVVLIKMGEVEMDLQLDLWADTVPMLRALHRAVEDSMSNDIDGAFFGLRLNAGAAYYNRTVIYGLEDIIANTDESQAFRYERRRTLKVSGRIEWVRLKILPAFRPNPQFNFSGA